MKKPALQNKDVGVLGMAFRARKVFGTFEKRAPGQTKVGTLSILYFVSNFRSLFPVGCFKRLSFIDVNQTRNIRPRTAK